MGDPWSPATDLGDDPGRELCVVDPRGADGGAVPHEQSASAAPFGDGADCAFVHWLLSMRATTVPYEAIDMIEISEQRSPGRAA